MSIRQIVSVCELKKLHIVIDLIKKINSNTAGLTPLHWVMSLGKCTKILQILLNNGANVNAISKENETPLNAGIEKGEDKITEKRVNPIVQTKVIV